MKMTFKRIVPGGEGRGTAVTGLLYALLSPCLILTIAISGTVPAQTPCSPCITMNWGGNLRYNTTTASYFAISVNSGKIDPAICACQGTPQDRAKATPSFTTP